MINYHPQGESVYLLEDTAYFLNRVMNKKHFSSDYIKWQYLDNPAGKAIAICASIGRTLVGHYAAQPLIAKIEGKEKRGLFILNAAVDPLHQGKGILRGIADLVHDQAFREGYSFMIGIGNKNSYPIYTKKFGFRSLGPIDVKIGLGMPKINSKKPHLYERYWDEKLLSWRMANPCSNYSIYQDDNQIIIYSRKYILLTIIMGHFPYHIKFNIINKQIKPLFNLFIGLDPNIVWEGNRNFISFPEVAKPSPMILMFRELQEDHIPIKKENILLRAIDFDAF